MFLSHQILIRTSKYTWVMCFSVGEDFCHTLHIMDSRGESVVVNKKCADQSECSPQRVGCLSIDTQTVSPQSYSVHTASVLQGLPFYNDLSRKFPDFALQPRFWSQNFTTAPRIIIQRDRYLFMFFDVFSTVHHSIELFHQPTLMHNFLYSLTICLLHYYPRHVSRVNMPIFRRKNCIHTVHSQPVYLAAVYRERRYQMLCEYNFSSWRWAC